MFVSDIRWWFSISLVLGSVKSYLIAVVDGIALPENTRGGYGEAWAKEALTVGISSKR